MRRTGDQERERRKFSQGLSGSPSDGQSQPKQGCAGLGRTQRKEVLGSLLDSLW